MKPQNYFKFLSKNVYFRTSLVLFSIIGFLSFANPVFGQDNLTKEQTEAVFKSLAKYTTGAVDKTSQLLQKHGFQPPSYLQREWKQYPAIRKIEMAYEAAENGRRGKGGKQFLALLSKDLAQKYEAINHEEKLKPMIEKNLNSEKIKFKHPKKYGNIKLPSQIKKQILSISKYTEVGALGGTRGVLKYKFGLPDDQVYDILRSSNSSKEALEKGLSKAKVPPTHQERLQNVSRELRRNYNGAKDDKALAEAAKDKHSNAKKSIERKKVTADFQKKTQLPNSSVKPKNDIVKAKYTSYTKTNYPTPKARKFSSMKIKRGGFGGVIFGNDVYDKSSLPNLKFMKYIPSENLSPDGMAIGMLELIFDDGSEYFESYLLEEDILAAYEIVFGNEIKYVDGDGIGLAGIENNIFYPDSSNRWEALVHPSIANLELGWAALLSDVFPIASKEMLERLEKGGSEDDYLMGILWSTFSTPQTWKIIDVPISISNQDNQLIFSRNDLDDSLKVENAFITMQGFGPDSLPKEERIFYMITPSLTNSIYEFHRINEFAKVLALFRWAKAKGGTLVNLPKNITYVNAAESVFITNDRKIEYYTLQEEIDKFIQFRNEILENIETELINLPSSPTNKLNEKFKNELKSYHDEILSKWNLILQPEKNSDKLCDIEITSPDSLLATSLFNNILKGTDVFYADSLTNLLQELNNQFVEIELTRLLFMSQADSILGNISIDSLSKFKLLIETFRNIEGENQLEKEIAQEKILRQIDELFSNNSSEYALLLFYKQFINFSIEEATNEISSLDLADTGYREWRENYENLIKVLSIEQKVMQASLKRYCPN